MRFAPQETCTYFVMASTSGRRRLFQVHANCELLMALFRDDRAKSRYQVHEFAIMPDHIHVVLTPAPEVPPEKAVQYVKGGFSFRLKSKLGVWDSGYNEVQIRDSVAYESIREYIAQNSVEGGLMRRAEEYRFSSAGAPHEVDSPPPWLCPERAQG